MMFFSLCANLIPFKPNLRVNRILPRFTTVDETTTYEVEITNLNLKPEKGLILYDDLPSPPRAEHYLIDPDRSTLRLSTGYPVDLSRRLVRRSSKNEDGLVTA